MVAYAARPRVVLVRAVAIALGGDACGASTAARPCRRDDQCEPGETCARRADDVVDACKPTSADQGEGAPPRGRRRGRGRPRPHRSLRRRGRPLRLRHRRPRGGAALGPNGRGQLGRAQGASDAEPAALRGLDDVTMLAVGHAHVVALGADGDNHGGLTCASDGTTTSCLGAGLPPRAIVGLSGVRRLVVSMSTACGERDGGAVVWVDPRGGSSLPAVLGGVPATPCALLTGGAAFAVNGEGDNACLVDADRAVLRAGDNIYGVAAPDAPEDEERALAVVVERAATAVSLGNTARVRRRCWRRVVLGTAVVRRHWRRRGDRALSAGHAGDAVFRRRRRHRAAGHPPNECVRPRSVCSARLLWRVRERRRPAGAPVRPRPLSPARPLPDASAGEHLAPPRLG